MSNLGDGNCLNESKVSHELRFWREHVATMVSTALEKTGMKIDVALNLRYTGIVLLIAGPVLIFLAGVSYLSSRSAQSWPTVTARVVSSEIKVSKKAAGIRGGRTLWSDYYTANVQYDYVVDGKHYTGDRIHLASDVCGFDRSVAEQWIRKCPQGASITVHVAPQKPSRSVIDPTADVAGLALLLAAGGVMLPVGAVLLQVARNFEPRTTSTPTPVRAAVPPALTHNKGDVKRRRAHWLVRTFAVILGLFLFLFGALAFPKCVELLCQGRHDPNAETAEMVAGYFTTAILGGIGLLGAYLILKATPRVPAR